MLYNKDIVAKYIGLSRGIVNADYHVKIAICDDEAEYTSYFKQILEHELEGMGVCAKVDAYTNSQSLLENEEEYDMIFLDIEMPDKNGLQIAKELGDKREWVKVIFMTNYAEYLQEAYKVQPFRYLFKTDSIERIRNAILDALEDDIYRTGVLIEIEGRCYDILLRQILYIQALGDEVAFFMADGGQYIVRTTLKNIHMELDKNFIRCNRGTLVNLQHIDSIHDTCIILDEGTTITISIRERKRVREGYREYKKRRLWK